MSSSVLSIADRGSSGLVVTIECSLSNNLPNIVIVGFVSRAVDEARERVRGAFTSSNIDLPRKRITINLAPADIPKASSSFDLAIAASILQASAEKAKGANIHVFTPKEAILGELSLDGSVRPVRGIIGKLMTGRRGGITRFYVPAANLAQARLVPDVEVVPVSSLTELYGHMVGTTGLVGQTSLQPPRTSPRTVHQEVRVKRAAVKAEQSRPDDPHTPAEVTFADVIGQEQAKRALERLPLLVAIMFCSAGRPAPARVCLPAPCPRFCRRSAARRCSRLRSYTACAAPNTIS
jgi:magnesium chelatase family protein